MGICNKHTKIKSSGQGLKMYYYLGIGTMQIG